MDSGVVIVAAGTGKRLQQSQHKALVPLLGRPLFLWSAEIFLNLEAITEVVVVVHEHDIQTFTTGSIAEELSQLGPCRVVAGGAERQDSVLAGLKALGPNVTKALIHDAARPFVTSTTVAMLLGALDHSPAAVPVVPVASTVKQVDGDGKVSATIPRGALRLAQTPQAARKTLLISALEQAIINGDLVTDDVQAMELAGHEVTTVEDSPWNFKVTTPADLRLAELVARENLHLGEEQ